MRTNWKTRVVCGSVLALMLLTTDAFAGIRKGNWEVGFGLGATSLDSNVTDDSATYVDVRGGYFFNDTFQLEGQASGAISEEGILEISLTSLFANAVFNFHPKDQVVPYFLVGLGSTTLEVSVPGLSVDDEAVSYQAAVGSRFFVGSKKKMAVRVELNGMSEDTFGESSTHVSFSAGLTWRIGPGW